MAFDLVDIEGLIARIYDAALNEELWSGILVELLDYSGADAAHLFIMAKQEYLPGA